MERQEGYYWVKYHGKYEIAGIKTQKEGYAFGVKFKAGEVYPNNEDFGKIAWCYTDKSLALKKYFSIV